MFEAPSSRPLVRRYTNHARACSHIPHMHGVDPFHALLKCTGCSVRPMSMCGWSATSAGGPRQACAAHSPGRTCEVAHTAAAPQAQPEAEPEAAAGRLVGLRLPQQLATQAPKLRQDGLHPKNGTSRVHEVLATLGQGERDKAEAHQSGRKGMAGWAWSLRVASAAQYYTAVRPAPRSGVSPAWRVVAWARCSSNGGPGRCRRAAARG